MDWQMVAALGTIGIFLVTIIFQAGWLYATQKQTTTKQKQIEMDLLELKNTWSVEKDTMRHDFENEKEKIQQNRHQDYQNFMDKLNKQYVELLKRIQEIQTSLLDNVREENRNLLIEFENSLKKYKEERGKTDSRIHERLDKLLFKDETGEPVYVPRVEFHNALQDKQSQICRKITQWENEVKKIKENLKHQTKVVSDISTEIIKIKAVKG